MAKRACFTLPAVAATLLCMTGCAQNGGFTLALNSKAFPMSISAQSVPSLGTHHREGEGHFRCSAVAFLWRVFAYNVPVIEVACVSRAARGGIP